MVLFSGQTFSTSIDKGKIYYFKSNKLVGYITDSKIEEIRQGIIDSPLIDSVIKEII
jgi:hypothetical protein